jgi:hypothetical protein
VHRRADLSKGIDLKITGRTNLGTAMDRETFLPAGWKINRQHFR